MPEPFRLRIPRVSSQLMPVGGHKDPRAASIPRPPCICLKPSACCRFAATTTPQVSRLHCCPVNEFGCTPRPPALC